MAQRGRSHIATLRPKYIPYSYMDPLGRTTGRLQNQEVLFWKDKSILRQISGTPVFLNL